MITFEVKITFLGIHGHTAVIAYMLMSTGRKIKQRSLATVRISDQGNIDGATFTLRLSFHIFFFYWKVFG